MPKEPFLVNPVRVGKTRKRRSPLPPGLLSANIKKYGARLGMKKAWEEYRGGKSGGLRKNYWKGEPERHTTAASKGWRKRKKHTSGYAATTGAVYPRKNPFLGEEVLVVGMNPKRKRKARKSSKKTAVRRFSSNPRRAHKRVVRRRKHAVVRYKGNPVRRHRRNPVAKMAALGGGGEISLSKPQTLLIPIAIGVAARMATQKVPAMVGMTTGYMKYGVQAGVAIGGGMLLKNFVGQRNAMVWTIVSGVTIVEELLNQFVFNQAAAVAGFGAFVDESQLGAYPSDVDYSNDGPY